MLCGLVVEEDSDVWNDWVAYETGHDYELQGVGSARSSGWKQYLRGVLLDDVGRKLDSENSWYLKGGKRMNLNGAKISSFFKRRNADFKLKTNRKA